jgi:phthiodiolone/phenolphthiodiolone dimycocerosates ketoreductase
VPVKLGVPGQIMPPAARAIDLARRAEADGFDSVWWPCHLMGWHPDAIWTPDVTPLAESQASPHVYFDPLAMMAAVGAATERIAVGVAVTDLIRRHPAMLAQAALTVDHLSGGRAIVGLGTGERLNVSPYGMEWDRPVGRLEEGIRVMRLLWGADGPVDFEGRFFRLRRAVLGLRPLDGRPPPVWVAAHAPRMLRITGTLADGWLPTKMEPDEYRERRRAIEDAARAAGRPGAVEPGMLAYVLAAPDEAALAELCARPLVRLLCVLLPQAVLERFGGSAPPDAGGSGFHEFIPTAVDRDQAERIVTGIPPDVVRYYTFHGDAERIAAQVRRYAEAGLRHLVMWNVTAFAEPSLARWSFGVLREVRAALGARVPT